MYVGFSILEISKTCVYDFHYSYMISTFKNACKLLYTDTDSLIYEVKCDDIYAIIKRDIERFDTSDYPVNNVYGIPLENKKIVGLMKDECNGNVMLKFAGLRSKMYSIEVKNNKSFKKAKGVNTAVVEKTITFQHYVECLRNQKIHYRTQFNIASKNHITRTLRQYKIALSSNDDKRFLLPNTTDTLPWGHYAIKNYCNVDNDSDSDIIMSDADCNDNDDDVVMMDVK